MSLKYLLDTGIVSEPLRPRASRTVLKRLAAHQDECAIASLVWHELQFGCERLGASRRRDEIRRYLDEVVLQSFPILDYGREPAAWHARERARLEAAGRPVPFVDGQIAAVACVNDLTFVTTNQRDFHAFKGLRVADWL